MTNDNCNDRGEYTQITWPEVRKGDVLVHGNGDRLTVSEVDGNWLSAPGSQRHIVFWREHGFTPYRPKPEMPTEPGAFLDKDGEVVLHCPDDDCGDWFDGVFWRSPGEMEHRAPFTRLVPMPTEEQVRRAVNESALWLDSRSLNVITAAVMALLAGDKQGVES